MADKDEIIAGAQAAARTAFTELPTRLHATMREYTRSAAQAIVDSADQAIANVYPGENLNTLKSTADRLDADLKELADIAEEIGVPPAQRPQFTTLYRMWSPRDDARAAVIDLFCQWFVAEAPDLRGAAAGWLDSDLKEHPLKRSEILAICRSYLMKTGQTRGLSNPVVILQIGSHAKTSYARQLLVRVLPPMGPRTPTPRGFRPGNELAALLLGRAVGESERLPGWRDQMAGSLGHNRLFDDTRNFIASDYDYLNLGGLASAFSASLARHFGERFSAHISLAALTPPPPEQDSLRSALKSALLPMAGYSAMAAALLSALYFTVINTSGPEQARLVGTAFAAIFGFVLSLCAQGAVLAVTHWRKRFEACVEDMTEQVETKVIACARSAWAETVDTLDLPLARQVVGMVTLVKKRPLDYALEGEMSIPNDTAEAAAAALSVYAPLLPGTVISEPVGTPVAPARETGETGEPLLPRLAGDMAGYGGAIFAVIGGITGAVLGNGIGCIPGVIIGAILGSLIGGALIYLLIAGFSAAAGAILGGASHQGGGAAIGITLGLTAGVILIVHGVRSSRLPSLTFMAKLAAGLIAGFFGIAWMSAWSNSQNSTPSDGQQAPSPSASSPSGDASSDQSNGSGAPTAGSSEEPPIRTDPPVYAPPDSTTGTSEANSSDAPPADTPPAGSVSDRAENPIAVTGSRPDPETDIAQPGSGLTDEPLPTEVVEGRRVTDDDLSGLSLHALSISYNQIYAIHGYIFKRPWLRAYFSDQSWYQPNPQWAETNLTPLEKQNLATIRSYERTKFGF